MPPRYSQTRRSTRSSLDKASRMKTRATGSQSGPSPDRANAHLEYDGDIDQRRPRKVARTSDGQGDVHSSDGSSVAMVAPVTRTAIDNDESDPESQTLETADDVEDRMLEVTEDPSQEDADGLQAPEPGQFASDSRQSTPMLDHSQDIFSLNISGSPALPSIKNATLSQVKNGQAMEKGTPEPGKVGVLGRLPGRRRAPHPDLDIEVDLRRQLELKVAYRAVAKALKPVLAELADRTTRELEVDEALHKSYPEFDEVITELDDRLQRRLRILEAQLHEEEERRKREHEAVDDVVRKRYQHECTDRRDDLVLQCQRHVLSLVQESRADEDSDATDYEDEIMPGTYRVDKLARQRLRMAKGYESRSRGYVETDHRWNDLGSRIVMRKTQMELDPSTLQSRPRDFAVFDGQERRAALASLNVLQLIDAGKEIHDIAQRAAAKPIANSEATGLQILADASNMEALRHQAHYMPMQTMAPVRQQVPEMSPQFYAGPTYNTPRKPHLNTQGTSASGKKASRRRKSPKFHQILVPPTYIYPGQYPQPGPFSGPQPYYQPYPYQMPPGPPSHDHRMAPQVMHLEQSQAPPQAPVPVVSHPQQAFSTSSLDSRSQRPGPDQPIKYEERDPLASASSVVPTTGADYPKSSSTIARGQPWTPFSNTMPLPNNVLPKYIKDNGLVRPEAEIPNPIISKTGPSKSTSEWPGFSSNSSANHGRAASFDAQSAQRSTFPGLTQVSSPGRNPSQPSWPHSINRASPLRESSGPGAGSPGASRPDVYRPTPTSQAPEPSPFFQPPPSNTSFNSFNNRPGPYLTQTPGLQQPPPSMTNLNYHNYPPPSSRPPKHEATAATSGSSPRRSNFSPPLRWPSDRRDSRPTTPQNRFPSHLRTQTAQAPSNRSPLPPLAPQAQYNNSRSQATQPGQSGHQRILPANMDPNRRASGGSESTSSTAYDQRIPYPLSAGAQPNNPMHTPPVSSPGPGSAPASTGSFRDGSILHAGQQHARHDPYARFSSPASGQGSNQSQGQTQTQTRPPSQPSSRGSPATQQPKPQLQPPKGQAIRFQFYQNIAPAPHQQHQYGYQSGSAGRPHRQSQSQTQSRHHSPTPVQNQPPAQAAYQALKTPQGPARPPTPKAHTPLQVPAEELGQRDGGGLEEGPAAMEGLPGLGGGAPAAAAAGSENGNAVGEAKMESSHPDPERKQ